MEEDARTFAFKANLNAFLSTNALKDFSVVIMEEKGLLKDCVLACFSSYSLQLECNCKVLFMGVHHLKIHQIYSTENCEYIEFLKMLWLVALEINRFTFFYILIVIFLNRCHWSAVYKAGLPSDNRFLSHKIYRLAKREQFRQLVGKHYLVNNYKADLHYAFHFIFTPFPFVFFCWITLNWVCAVSNEH